MVTHPTQPDHSSDLESAVPGLAPADFRLGGDGLPPEAIAKVHARFLAYLSEKKATFLGYQLSQDLEYKEVLKDYLDLHVNNIGDPFQHGNLTTNSMVPLLLDCAGLNFGSESRYSDIQSHISGMRLRHQAEALCVGHNGDLLRNSLATNQKPRQLLSLRIVALGFGLRCQRACEFPADQLRFADSVGHPQSGTKRRVNTR